MRGCGDVMRAVRLFRAGKGASLYWVVVKNFNWSYYIWETPLDVIDT